MNKTKLINFIKLVSAVSSAVLIVYEAVKANKGE